MCWQAVPSLVMLSFNLFWYEFLRFVFLSVALPLRKCECKKVATVINFLVYLEQKASSDTAFLLRVYHNI
jgi:hypothetical protein